MVHVAAILVVNVLPVVSPGWAMPEDVFDSVLVCLGAARAVRRRCFAHFVKFGICGHCATEEAAEPSKPL